MPAPRLAAPRPAAQIAMDYRASATRLERIDPDLVNRADRQVLLNSARLLRERANTLHPLPRRPGV